MNNFDQNQRQIIEKSHKHLCHKKPDGMIIELEVEEVQIRFQRVLESGKPDPNIEIVIHFSRKVKLEQVRRIIAP
jgi:hypothetical protein